ncbi:cell envelope integrity protein TolA [Litoreibacter roseus]|uniref:TonB C-terminal domain-containing protein n=1 Tax=Litoreibacter roseus TaxID=2601869 RepID=A0A6N6JEY1_9RHOB|nr:energy transducer TonB [Litoreibacter roseus]GFE64684.1 hypothetical protein KIN_17580 [Litoreibacter roseus]
MIATSRWIAGLALIAAAVLHLAGLVRMDFAADIEIAGGQVGATQASLGNAFADMAEGTLTRVEATEINQPLVVEQMAKQQDVQKITETVSALPEAKPVSDGTVTMVPSATDTAATPNLTTLAPMRPMQTTPIAPTAPVGILQAEDPTETEVSKSLRPKPRKREFVERNAMSDKPPTPDRARRADATPQGNEAQTNARAGQSDGVTSTPHAQRTTGSPRSTQEGNAAASNYPGQVMSRIQRVRRPSLRTRGTATIAFRIATNGGLSAISLVSSSGSAELDRVALQIIQRAAPFPIPPKGAQRSFSIPIKGR